MSNERFSSANHKGEKYWTRLDIPLVTMRKKRYSGFPCNEHSEVEIREAVATGAFEYLMNNNVERHDEMILSIAKEATKSSDMLVLAQASMARLAPRISNEVGLPVLSSPRLGAEYLKTILD